MGARTENKGNDSKKSWKQLLPVQTFLKKGAWKEKSRPGRHLHWKITPDGIEKGTAKKVDTSDTEVVVKEYGFSRAIELLCPAGWKEPLGKIWQEVLDFIIVRWCKRHLEELRRHMPFPHGIPSVSTMSRMLSSVDEEMVSLSIMNWIGEISNTRGIHIAIDGKGLRAAAHKIKDERTPYVLNAIDVASKLVIGQLAIMEKSNEMSAIPELVELMQMEGSIVTTDAIGATGRIMDAIHDRGGDFVLQVKKNCPALYDELMRLFDGLEEEQSADKEGFRRKYGGCYSGAEASEKNRERREYRKHQSYSDADGIKAMQEERPHIACVGRYRQVRILLVQDGSGNDITPSLKEFLKEGSRKQPGPTAGDRLEDDMQRAGLISSKVLDAEQLMEFKRQHWAVENRLHYVLDEVFGEDKSTIRAGKNTMSFLRKCAYNIARLLQMEAPEKREYIPDVIDDVCDNLELGFKIIFNPVPSLY